MAASGRYQKHRAGASEARPGPWARERESERERGKQAERERACAGRAPGESIRNRDAGVHLDLTVLEYQLSLASGGELLVVGDQEQ